MIFVCLLIVALVSLLMGLIVFANNPKTKLNRMYLLFSISSAAWMCTNAFALDSSPLSLSIEARNTITQLIIVSATLSALSFLLFVETLVGASKRTAKFTKYLIAFSVVINLFTFTDAYSLIENGSTVIGDYYGVFAVSIALYMALTAKVLFSPLKADVVDDARRRSQISYLRIGYVLSVVPSFIFGGILATFSSSDLPAISPIFLIFFLTFSALAIVKHRLFDIRAVFARSLAYSLLISSLAGIYALSVFLFTVTLFENAESVSLVQQLSYLVSATFAAFTLAPLKKFFDRVTQSVFYRDSYDTKELLNEFNKVIVSTIDLTQLLLRAGSTIEKYVQPDSISFAVLDDHENDARVISISQFALTKQTTREIRGLAGSVKDKIVVTDLLPDSELKLKRILQEANIGLVARITTNISTEGNGYIIMGYKKSGNMYNTQDIESMEIVANELAIAMQNALQFEEIQKFNITLQKKIDEATHKLQKNNEKLKSLDVAKDEFIGMASHQLRTPLTSVKGYVSMVLEGDAGKVNPKQAELLESAFTSSQRMVYLIADLLNVSRLKTGKFVIETKEVDLPEVIEGEVEQLLATAKNRRLKLNYKKPKNFPLLMLDETKTRQVIMNFIDNAIYYTPSGGKIDIILEHNNHSVTYKVVDNGIGVPKEEQAKLFTKFFRAGNARKARPDGTGLGLFMAKKVVVAQGGAILFESNPGKGSTFGFVFPLSTVKAPDNSSDN